MKPLLVTPHPFKQESLFGYVLRLVEANGYDSANTILSYIGATTGDLAAEEDISAKLADITGVSPALLRALQYRDHVQSDLSHPVLLGAKAAYSKRASPFNYEYPKICTACVSEKGYIDAFWDLRFAVACPIHKVLPLDKCGCGKRLSWQRPGLTSCSCEQSLIQTSPGAAEAPVVTLMSLLYSKIPKHAKPKGLKACGFPYQALRATTLQSMLSLIDMLVEFTAPARLGPAQKNTLAAVSAAAELLSNWPSNFHEFLRRQNHDNVGGPKKKTSGFRWNHVRGSLLLNRVRNFTELAFVTEAFFEYGRANGETGIVDARSDGIPANMKRFVSLQGAAIGLGVSVTTLSKWRKTGLLAATVVDTGKANRYVIDKDAAKALKKPIVKPLQVKEAAAHVGLPISTLYQLRSAGVLPCSQSATRAKSFYRTDLDTFLLELCKIAPVISELPPDVETVTFSHVVKKMKLFSDTGKADFVVAYLEGLVKPLGRTGMTLDDIYFAAKTVKTYTSEKRNRGLAGTIAQTVAAEELECTWRVIPTLIENGLLDAVDTPKGRRVTPESVAAFKSAYASVNGLAERFDATHSQIVKLLEKNGIERLSIPGNPPFDKLPFFKRTKLKVMEDTLMNLSEI